MPIAFVTGHHAARFGLAFALGITATVASGAEMKDYVDLNPENFVKEIDGKTVGLFTIKNQNGLTVRITSYGARIEQILVPDREGRLGDVALGYETIDQVLEGQASMGAFIGRF